MKTTKELARELGLLRKRTLSSTGVHRSSERSQGQVFKYLIVIDFESTCWQDGKFRTQEIIEFPAVLLNTRTGEIESEFHHYVQPQEQPVLSSFCTELTGIKQCQVDDGIPISLCLKKFMHWLDKLNREKDVVCHGSTTDKEKPVNTTCVTWSDWDLGVCLQYECKRKQLIKPVQFNTWIDLRATYRKFYDRKPNGLNGALQDLGREFQGREHSGVDDARNTAKLAYRMIRDGCSMKTTRQAKTHERSVSCQPILQCVTIATRKTPPRKAKQKNNIASSSFAVNGNETCSKGNKTPTKTIQGPLSKEMTNLATDRHVGDSSVEAPVNKTPSRIKPAESSLKKLKDRTPSKIPVTSKSPNKQNARNPLQSSGKSKTPSKLPSDNYVQTKKCQKENSPTKSLSGLLAHKSNCSDLVLSGKENSCSDTVLQISESSLKRKQFTPVKEKVNSPIRKKMRQNSPGKNSVNSPIRKKMGEILSGKFSVSDVYVDPEMNTHNQQKTDRNTIKKGLKVQDTNVGKNESTTKSDHCSKQLLSDSSACFKKPSSVNDQSTQFGFKVPCTASATTPSLNGLQGNRSKGQFATSTPSTPLAVSNTAKLYSPPSLSCFVTPSEIPKTTPHVFKTPYQTPYQSNTNRFSNSISSMKVTPPLCKCGRRSRRRMVQSPGQNMGRFFFSCAVKKSVGTKEGCEFFKWETSSMGNESSVLSKQFTPVRRSSGQGSGGQKKSLGVKYAPGQKSFIRC